MPEFLEESSGLESTTIGIYRTAATVKGGRRFSFGAMVVVGDRNGSVGLGYGKAPGVPAAIEKAQKSAKKNLKRVGLYQGTLPHSATGRYLASIVKMVPASPGTGVIAGGTVRAVLEMAGVRDCLTKSLGSNNQKNLAKATLNGLNELLSKQKIEELRGQPLEKTVVEAKVEVGEHFVPRVIETSAKDDKKSKHGGKGKGRGRGGQQGRGRGRGGRRDGQPAPPTAATQVKDQPAVSAPPAEAEPPQTGPAEGGNAPPEGTSS